MFHSYDLSSALAYDDAWRHGIAGCHAWHDRTVRYAKIVDSIDLEIAIYDRHRIATHLGGASLVIVGSGCVADEIFKCCAFQVTWHHLALDETTKGSGIADFAAKLDTGYGSLHVVRMREAIVLGPDRIERVRSRQTDLTYALRSHDTTEH